MNRIAELRRRCLQRKKDYPQDKWGHASMIKARSIEKHPELWCQTILRQAVFVKDILSELPFDLNEYELLAGRVSPVCYTEQEIAYRDGVWRHQPNSNGQTGHTEIDYPLILKHGINGIRRIIQAKIAALDTTDWRDHQKQEFYDACLLSLDGFETMAKNCRDLVLQQLAQTTDTTRRRELEELAAVLAHIPLEPAQTFYQALQALILTSIACEYSQFVIYIVPGRLDRSLWSYYQADLEAGRITKEKALELLECLYILINDNNPDGGAVSVMVGGQDDRGCDTTNELSYLCLEALRRTNLIYPTVGLCWSEKTPDDLSALACDLIRDGICTPAFFGDDTIAKGLKHYGIPPEQAYHYINSTCVEITPIGNSNVYVASPYFNLCQLLLDAMLPAASFASFEAFLTQVEARIAREIETQVRNQNNIRFSRLHLGGKPLQSIFTKGCLESGQDIDWGGAEVNWIECSFVGLANFADCLYAVRQEVFAEKKLTMAELQNILKNNFTGAEAVRQRLLSYPKYGNAIAEVDQFVSRLTDFLRQQCDRYRVYPDSQFVPGFFCWQMHEHLGRTTGATPDGRLAGFPFADGSGPAQGREKQGPTGAILSSTSWEHWPMIGGLVLNLKFPQSVFKTPTAVKKLKELIISYLKMGGFEVQINVIDNKTLRLAQSQPEQFADLVVRIAGYTDYFTRLSPQMQAEVLMRSELPL